MLEWAHSTSQLRREFGLGTTLDPPEEVEGKEKVSGVVASESSCARAWICLHEALTSWSPYALHPTAMPGCGRELPQALSGVAEAPQQSGYGRILRPTWYERYVWINAISAFGAAEPPGLCLFDSSRALKAAASLKLCLS